MTELMCLFGFKKIFKQTIFIEFPFEFVLQYTDSSLQIFFWFGIDRFLTEMSGSVRCDGEGVLIFFATDLRYHEFLAYSFGSLLDAL